MTANVTFDVADDPPRVTAHLADRTVNLPALWLRERCQDEAHLDPVTQQRLFDPHRLPVDLRLVSASPDANANADRAWLEFSDGYAGWYDLRRIATDIAAGDELPPPRPWDASLSLSDVRFDWPSIKAGTRLPQAVARFLEYGFILLEGVPRDSERILEVARAFGHPRETNFGRYFEVYSRPDSNDLAYRAVALGPHTDNPYREPVPGVQLLHCLVNETRGGESTLVDSIAVTDALAAEDPRGLELLATIPVRFRFTDDNEALVEQRPIVRRDDDGQVTGVHYSPRLDYLPVLDEDTTRHFHAARRRLGELFADPAFSVQFPLAAGELVMFDNSRVLHGRTAYDPSEGHRHLQGCYIDLDGPRSLHRVVNRKQE